MENWKDWMYSLIFKHLKQQHLQYFMIVVFLVSLYYIFVKNIIYQRSFIFLYFLSNSICLNTG